jgi:excisionase family DNA binding protein
MSEVEFSDATGVGRPPPDARPATYTVPEIAALAQTSERHVWRLASMNKIPGRVKGLGRLVRFSRSEIDGWLAGQPIKARGR